jgi:hypothetical protein
MSSSSNNRNNNGNNNRLQKKEQIPTEYNEKQTRRVVRKQDEIPGEGREKTINDFPYAAPIAQALKDIEFSILSTVSTLYYAHKCWIMNGCYFQTYLSNRDPKFFVLG